MCLILGLICGLIEFVLYFDYVVIFFVCMEVFFVMVLYFIGVFGNFLSYYIVGEVVVNVFEDVCVWVVGVFGMCIGDVVFIGGGIEVNNFVVKGIVFVGL